MTQAHVRQKTLPQRRRTSCMKIPSASGLVPLPTCQGVGVTVVLGAFPMVALLLLVGQT